MVTIGKKFGRLANRLWVFSYFAANAIEHDYPLTYRYFDSYIKYFDSTSKNDFLGHRIKARLSLNPIADHLLYWINFLKHEYYNRYREKGRRHVILRTKKTGNGHNLNDPEFVRLATTTHVITRDGGFWFNDNDNLKKHAGTIRKIFEPKEKYRKNIDALLEKCHRKGDCIVGVHLRKRDFATAFGGSYYYHDAFYLEQILHAETILKKAGKIPVFVLCSDEPLKSETFREVNFLPGNGHLVEDLYTFARCDYLIGPPSTYTAWASFYGRAPIHYLVGHDSPNFSLKDFRIIENISQIYHLIE